MAGHRHGSEVRRPEIVAAARALVVEAGPEACSTPAIARAVGVTSAALYRHFANKDEIVAGVVVAVLADLSARLDAASAGVHGLQAVVRSSAAFLRFTEDCPGEARLLDHLVGAPGEVLPGGAATPVLAATAALLGRIARAFDEASGVGALSDAPGALRAVSLWASLSGAARLGKVARRGVTVTVIDVRSVGREVATAMLVGWGADRRFVEQEWEEAWRVC